MLLRRAGITCQLLSERPAGMHPIPARGDAGLCLGRLGAGRKQVVGIIEPPSVYRSMNAEVFVAFLKRLLVEANRDPLIVDGGSVRRTQSTNEGSKASREGPGSKSFRRLG